MPEVYVAYSVHGSHCFITANKKVSNKPSGSAFSLDGFDFTITQSRTASLRNATKLNWDRLNRAKPEAIFAAFQELKEKGWTVEDTAFKQHHKIKDKPAAAIAPPQTPKSEKTTEETVATSTAHDTTMKNQTPGTLAENYAAAPTPVSEPTPVPADTTDTAAKPVPSDSTLAKTETTVNSETENQKTDDQTENTNKSTPGSDPAPAPTEKKEETPAAKENPEPQTDKPSDSAPKASDDKPSDSKPE